MQEAAQMRAYRWIGVQAVVVLIVALAWSAASTHAATSALFGGIACIIPNLLFARHFFAKVRARGDRQVLTAFYWGELLKLALSVVFLLLLLTKAQVQILPLFIGFLGAHLGLWIAPFVLRSRAINQDGEQSSESSNG